MDIYQESKIDLEEIDHQTFGSVAPLIAETWNQMMDDLSKRVTTRYSPVKFTIEIPNDYILRAEKLLAKSKLNQSDMGVNEIFSMAIFKHLVDLEKDMGVDH